MCLRDTFFVANTEPGHPAGERTGESDVEGKSMTQSERPSEVIIATLRSIRTWIQEGSSEPTVTHCKLELACAEGDGAAGSVAAKLKEIGDYHGLKPMESHIEGQIILTRAGTRWFIAIHGERSAVSKEAEDEVARALGRLY